MSNDPVVKSIRDEPWFVNVPEWMGEVVVLIVEARDEARALMQKLNDREVIAEKRDERASNDAIALADKQQALINACEDMKNFANTIYGPESAIAQINSKLDSIQRNISDSSAENERFRVEVDKRFKDLEERVALLERKTA